MVSTPVSASSSTRCAGVTSEDVRDAAARLGALELGEQRRLDVILGAIVDVLECDADLEAVLGFGAVEDLCGDPDLGIQRQA